MTLEAIERLRAYVEYFRDMGVCDLYRRGEASAEVTAELAALLQQVQTAKPPAGTSQATPIRPVSQTPVAPPPSAAVSPFEASKQRAAKQASASAVPIPVAEPLPELSSAVSGTSLGTSEIALVSLNQRIPIPQSHMEPAEKHAALEGIRNTIGDCTRCPLAYAGRRKIVFGDGSPEARLMFVGEGPGADEDQQGIPFVGKAGQLLNNMIAAMGLQRSEVYIANVVKCRPPGNRNPEPVEAHTCSQFLAEQMDVVQPEYVVALGSIAATYLLGVKKSLATLRGQWFESRGAKVAVTYHPAYLLRDPNMKGEAWKDLQRVMAAMGLKPPTRK